MSQYLKIHNKKIIHINNKYVLMISFGDAKIYEIIITIIIKFDFIWYLYMHQLDAIAIIGYINITNSTYWLPTIIFINYK